MATFQYKAVDRGGRAARGTLDAMNDVDLELRLRRMGLDMISFRAVEPRSIQSLGAVKRQDVINLVFDLEQISRAGIPMLDGLRDLRDGMENPRLREILTSVVEDMEGGRMLSQCLGQHPAIFNNVFVSLVRAGEQSGQMTEVLENLGTTLRMQDELAAQTRRLLVYPSIVLVVVLAVMAFLFTYLVPQVTGLLRTMGIDMPLQTRLMIGVSEIVRGYWYLLVGVPALAAGVMVSMVRSNDRARFAWDYVKLHVPITGPLLQKVIMARFANVFALLYRSGITILEALRTSEAIVDNRVIADSIARATSQINSGVSLTDAFRDLGTFPPLVIRMLRVGEATGALDTALANVTYFYNRDVRESIERGLKLLEPALIFVLGMSLLLIMWAVLSPVYDILGKLNL
ncbi:MAG: type II secretion system F family protein [Burkholderiales bacterium]|nr:type II secretion system F family protein [Burkholderiales bacterium]